MIPYIYTDLNHFRIATVSQCAIVSTILTLGDFYKLNP